MHSTGKSNDTQGGNQADESTAEVQAQLNELFGPAPLIPGEDPQLYAQLLALVTKAIAPSDILEAIWVRDMVELEWEIIRYRRIKTEFIVATAHGSEDYLDRIIKSQQGKDPALSLESVVVSLPMIERLDRVVRSMESRRDRAYRETVRRQAWGAEIRRASAQMQKAIVRPLAAVSDETKHAA